MPFQGNPNAGQADPALLQMLFSEKARREERDYKRAQDAMAAQQAQAEFLLKMRAEEQKQRRLQEAHEETMRGKRFENEGKFREFASGVGERQAALPPEARRANETAAIRQLAPTNDVASAFASGDPEEQAFLGIAQEADPGVFDQDLNQIGEATDLASLDPVTRSIIEREAKKQGFSISELFQTAETEAGVVESGRRRELQAEIAKEDRAEAASERSAQRAFNRSVRKFGTEIETLTDQISDQERVIATEPPNSPKRERAMKLKMRLESGLSKKLLENVDSGHFTKAQKWVDDNVSLMQESEAAVQDLKAFRDMAMTNPNFLGSTRGGLTQLISNFAEGASDIAQTLNVPGGQQFAQITESARSLLLNDPNLSEAERSRLAEDMGFGVDGLLQARTDAKMLTNRAAFILTRGQNPGRFSNEQYKFNRERIALDTGSAAQAARNLNTAISEMEAIASRTSQRLSLYENLAPGVGGGLATPEGDTVFAPTPGTNMPSTQANPQTTPPGLVPDAAAGNRAEGFLQMRPEEKRAEVLRRLQQSRGQ